MHATPNCIREIVPFTIFTTLTKLNLKNTEDLFGMPVRVVNTIISIVSPLLSNK